MCQTPRDESQSVTAIHFSFAIHSECNPPLQPEVPGSISDSGTRTSLLGEGSSGKVYPLPGKGESLKVKQFCAPASALSFSPPDLCL